MMMAMMRSEMSPQIEYNLEPSETLGLQDLFGSSSKIH